MNNEPKYKKGDRVGFKSDTVFTESNKSLPAMTVVRTYWDEGYKRYEYVLTYAQICSEHELEAR